MLKSLITKIVGSRNERLLKSYSKDVEATNALEPEYQKLDDAALKAKTAEFRQRHAGGESLDALLPEAFAAVREAAVRTLGMRQYDVQRVAGLVRAPGKMPA